MLKTVPKHRWRGILAIRYRRWRWLVAGVSVAALGVPPPASAGSGFLGLPTLGDAGVFALLLLTYPLQAVAWLLGRMMVLAVNFLSKIISVNDFIHFEAVEIGWVILRDVSNLVFVVILLLIAIATILRVESYNLKRLLPKLLLMAILVNFSKTISGLIIDAAQVFTLTFASAVSGVTQGNLYDKFGIPDLFTLSRTAFSASRGFEASQLFTLFASLLLSVFMLFVALMTVVAYLLVFLFRIVALWILVILSPLAYALAAFPQGERYSREWWSMFSKYVIVGPVLMFFFWVALVTSSQAFKTTLDPQFEITGELSTEDELLAITLTEATKPENMLKFLVMTCLMLGGLVAAQRVGVMGSQFAGSVLSGMRSAGMGAVRRAIRLQTAPLRAARFLAGEGAGALGRVINRRILETKGLRWMTPTFWGGMKKASQEKLERQRRIAAKFGEEFGERFVQERLLRRKGSVRNIGQEAERREVVEIKSQIQKDLSNAGFSKERLAYWARIAQAAGGKHGENMRQAFAEIPGSKGNWDDVYEMTVQDLHDKLGMTGAESLRENDQLMKKFMKGFLWRGDIAQANKYDPEEIYQQQNSGNAYLIGLHNKFKAKGVKAFVGRERDDYTKAMITAREQTDKNAAKASAKDKMRLLSLVNFSEEVKDTGHYEQLWGRTSEKTGQGRFRDELEQIDEVLGETGKVGARLLMQRIPPHVTRGKTYNPKTGAYEVDVEVEKMTPFHRAMADETGIIKPQSSGELGHSQGRKIDRDIGMFFYDKSDPATGALIGDLINNRAEAIKRGFTDEKHLQDQFVMWRLQNQVITDTQWQRKYTGAQNAKEGTHYSVAREGVPAGVVPLSWNTTPQGLLAAAAEARVRAAGWTPINPNDYAPPLMAEEVDPAKQAATLTKINEIQESEGLTPEAAREKYDRVYEKEIHTGTLYAGSEIVRQQKVEQAKAGLLAEDLDTMRGVMNLEQRNPEGYSAEELEQKPHLASASVGINFLDPEMVQRYNIDPENAERILALNYDNTTEEKQARKAELVDKLAEDYVRRLQREAEDFDRQIAAGKSGKPVEAVTNEELNQVTDDERRNEYQKRYAQLKKGDAERKEADQRVAAWAAAEFSAADNTAPVTAEEIKDHAGQVVGYRRTKGRVVQETSLDAAGKETPTAYSFHDAGVVGYQQGEALRQLRSTGEGIEQRRQRFHQILTNTKTISLHNNAAFGNVMTARRHEVGHTLTAQLSPAQQRAFRDKLISEQQQRYDQMGAEEYFARALGENTGAYALNLSPEAKKFLDELEVEDPITGKKRKGVRYRGSPKYSMPELEAEAMSAERRQQIINQRRERPEGQAEVLIGQELGRYSRRVPEIAAATEERRKRTEMLQQQREELQRLEQQRAGIAVQAQEHRTQAEVVARQRGKNDPEVVRHLAEARELEIQEKTLDKQAKRQRRAVGAGQRALDRLDKYSSKLEGRQNLNAFAQQMRQLISGVSVKELPNFMEKMKPTLEEFRKQLPASRSSVGLYMADHMERLVKDMVEDEAAGRQKLWEVTGQYRTPTSHTEANVQEVSTRQVATTLKRRQLSQQASAKVKDWQGIVEDTQRKINTLDRNREQAEEAERRHHADADRLAGQGQYTTAEAANQQAAEEKRKAVVFQQQIDELKVGPHKEAVMALDQAKVEERKAVDEATQATKNLVGEFHEAARQLQTEEETLSHRARADRDVEDFNALAAKYYQAGETEKGDEARERSRLAVRWRETLGFRQQELQLQAAPQRAQAELKEAEQNYEVMRRVKAPAKLKQLEPQVKALESEKKNTEDQIELLKEKAVTAKKAGNNQEYKKAQTDIMGQQEKLTGVERQLHTARVSVENWREEVEAARQEVEVAQQKLQAALEAQAVGVPSKVPIRKGKASTAGQVKQHPSEEGGKVADSGAPRPRFSGRSGPRVGGPRAAARPAGLAWREDIRGRLEDAYQEIDVHADEAANLPKFDSRVFSQWLHTTESTLRGIEEAVRDVGDRLKSEGKEPSAGMVEAGKNLRESIRGAFSEINRAYGSQAKPETYDQGDEMEHQLKLVNGHLEQLAENLGKPQEDLGEFPDEMPPT